MSQRNLIIITKIVAFYCLFYIGVKLYGIYTGMWFLPNLIIVGILSVFGIAGWLIIRSKKYNWPFAIIGAIVIVLLRIYEIRLINYLYENF
ncbi:hypothetical protein [Ascidiimonas sp. W6]|uniref:hypothetical protein n=1 Tax=Ascidiimonas meishanensis TaxID=3128903 RepID=UPI0030ECFB23